MPKYTEYQKVFRVSKTDKIKDRRRSRRQELPILDRPPSTAKESNGVTVDPVDRHDPQNETHRCNAVTGATKLSQVQRRLQQLEQVVESLAHTSPSASRLNNHLTPPHSEHFENGITHGHIETRGLEANYCGSTHWATILANIKDIQDCFGPESGDEGSDTVVSATPEEPDTIISSFEPITLDKACGLLPSRAVADKLLSAYFSAKYLHIPFIHKWKFMREYEAFWDNPSSVPYLWVAILFTALHLGAWIRQTPGDKIVQSRGRVKAQPYLTTAAQVLVAGKYQKGRPYSVEAALLYAICKFFQQKDQDTEPWLLMGVAARLALKMGYHRDPRHLSHHSPFEGEMRRRAFFIVQTFDLLLSFQAGLPATIHEEACDTEPPSNLFDDDFDEGSTALPASRPKTDPTPMLYYCHKGRLAQVFRRVARHALSPKFPPYEETMKIDIELHDMKQLTPPSLVMKSISSSITDETHVIFHRFNIELLYQKSLMILHRNYISHDRSNPKFAYSRRTCLEASIRLLECQAEAHAASQPGGQLSDHNYLDSSITFHDFLLAAMVACLDLYESHRQGGSTKTLAESEAQKLTYNALKVSHGIWVSRKTVSQDARRASAILAVMLAKIPDPNLMIAGQGVQNLASSLLSTGQAEQINPGHLGPALTSSADLPTPAHDFQDLLVDSLYLESGNFTGSSTFEAILGDAEVDWGLVDQYLLGHDFTEEF